MALLNYTTAVEAVRTVEEIQRILVAHGARSVLIDYADDGSVKALAFKVAAPQGELAIRLPVDPEATLKVLTRQYNAGKIPRRLVSHPQAVRVAWRIVKEWVAAQLAILETEMVKMEQIFLAYVITNDGRTVFERIAEQKFLLKEGTDA